RQGRRQAHPGGHLRAGMSPATGSADLRLPATAGEDHADAPFLEAALKDGSRFHVPGSRLKRRADSFPTWNLEPGTWNLEPPSGLEPGTLNLEPSSEPGTLNRPEGASSPEERIRAQFPDAVEEAALTVNFPTLTIR